jgi:hypothetical protein
MASDTCAETNRKIAFGMKVYTWNIPEMSQFLKHDRYMSWKFHTYDTVQIPDDCADAIARP